MIWWIWKRPTLKNQANNIGFVRSPFRIPYHPSQNQTLPNPDEGLTFEEIYSIFRALASRSQTFPNDTEENPKEIENYEPPDEKQDQHVNNIRFFFEITMVEEEYEPVTFFNVQNP